MKRTFQEVLMAISANLEMARLATLKKEDQEMAALRYKDASYQSGKAAAFLEAINLIKTETETQGIES